MHEAKDHLKEWLLDLDSRWNRGRLYLAKRASSLACYTRILQMNENPIIIGGCGRSGTTLLLSILSAHPSIFAVPVETYAFSGQGYHACPPPTPTIRIRRVYRQLCKAKDLAHKSRWCEKTPKNVVYIPHILDYLGDETRFINIVRDGRDVITSKHPKGGHFHVPPRRWVHDVMQGYIHRNHPQVHTIRYEDLVEDPEPVLRRICQFTGEDYAAEIQRYPETATVKTSSAWGAQRAQKIHRRSTQRWKAKEYEGVVAELMSMPRAELLLAHYGYLNAA